MRKRTGEGEVIRSQENGIRMGKQNGTKKKIRGGGKNEENYAKKGKRMIHD